MSAILDSIVAYKFITLLSTPWEETEAFDLGIIDKDGNPLKKTKDLGSKKEKEAYSIFHRLVFNIKRLLQKLPFGKAKLASFAAAALLLKEHMQPEDAALFEKNLMLFIKESGLSPTHNLTEQFSLHDTLSAGQYYVTEDTIDQYGDVVVAGHIVVVNESAKTFSVFGSVLVEATDKETGLVVLVPASMVKRHD
ncbi:MAG: hypothetical protein BV459_03995 [Thermoplasmata archaeon M11B2D]|nr:MAG: hypothetical protein BV459_03995 [Thermoplasmata archaeon M11B2D]